MRLPRNDDVFYSTHNSLRRIRVSHHPRAQGVEEGCAESELDLTRICEILADNSRDLRVGTPHEAHHMACAPDDASVLGIRQHIFLDVSRGIWVIMSIGTRRR